MLPAASPAVRVSESLCSNPHPPTHHVVCYPLPVPVPANVRTRDDAPTHRPPCQTARPPKASTASASLATRALARLVAGWRQRMWSKCFGLKMATTAALGHALHVLCPVLRSVRDRRSHNRWGFWSQRCPAGPLTVAARHPGLGWGYPEPWPAELLLPAAGRRLCRACLLLALGGSAPLRSAALRPPGPGRPGHKGHVSFTGLTQRLGPQAAWGHPSATGNEPQESKQRRHQR